MTRKIFTLILITSIFFFKSYAQQDSQFSQYMFNRLYLNPAYAGSDPQYMELSILHRSQWLGYEPTFNDDGGAPTTQVLSFQMPLTKYNIGVGIHLVNDQLGPLTNTEAQLSLAYHIKLKSGGQFSLGARGGVYNHSIDFNQLRFVDESDALNIGGRQNQITNDFGAGIYFQSDIPTDRVNRKSTRYFAGLSFNHLQQSQFDFDQQLSFNSLATHMTLIGGADFDISPSITISPSAIMKSDFNSYSFELSVLGTYDDKYYLGGSLRELEAAIFMIGTHFTEDNRLRVGYAFDLTIEARNAKETTSHELMLSYKIPSFKWFTPPVIRTPRFRHE